MFEVNKDILEEYARLAVLKGVNVKEGQTLLITAPVEAYKLVRECISIAYKEAKAKKVIVDYVDDDKTLLDYTYQDIDTLSKFPNYLIEKEKELIDDNYCALHIIGEDPDLLKSIDKEKLKASQMARMKAKQAYQYYFMNSVGQWSIIAWPNLAWAKKVFPNKNDDEAMNKLFEAILYTSRVELNKSIENWNAHESNLLKRAEKMNEYSFKSLHFKNSLGTDLTVGLIKDHIWAGGKEEASGKYKVSFNANIPTEEVFTMPDRYHIDGIVYSSKPLAYNGKVISGFNLTFKDGVVVDYKANDNLDVLENILNTDKGTKSLGEVALVPYDSPISKSNILFYDTLFDENASCHLALGACYPTTVKGGENLTTEELYKLGGNDSMEHVDFMFGTSDLSVVGETYDGQMIDVFKDGNFVF